MATKNFAGKWLAFTSSVWLYFCYMLFPTLSYAKGRELCNVASFWMYEYIGILLGARPILHISRIKVKRDEVPGEWRRLHNEELYGLFSPRIIRKIEFRKMSWDWHVAHMGRGEVHTGF
jgi:hypothetical protein